jgi:hypothetical protein
VDREYEIFESLDDGSVKWCTCATGLPNVRSKLDGLLLETGREYFAIHLSTHDVIFARDSSIVVSNRAANPIFHVAYNERQSLIRAELLRALGYNVVFAVGNEAAKALLAAFRFEDRGIALFMVGNRAPVQSRKEMVDWLRAHFPAARILALNQPNQKVPDADYNVEENGPEAWAPILDSTISSL